MKNARHHDQAGTSARNQGNYNPGQLPHRRNTVTAAVLAGLLEGQTLTGMSAVFNLSTTRLAAAVHYLESRYGWHIERHSMATGTNDGRVQSITDYWLSQAIRIAAFESNARQWVDAVREARVKQRRMAGKCKAEAARINAARKHASKQDPRQFGLWGEL